MLKEVIDITLSATDNDNIQLNVVYNPTPEVEITRVLLERYEIPKDETEKVAEIRKVVDEQSVMQYMGSKTATMSTLFHMGGGDIYVEPDLIDLGKGTERNFPKMIDSESDIINNFYVYRMLNYGQNYESATRYVVGLETFDAPIFNPALRDADFIKFLDEDDLKSLIPDNIDALKAWALSRSFFHETFRLRHRGEMEAFKFSSYRTRAFINIVFLTTMMDRIEEDLTEQVRRIRDEVHSTSS